MRIHSHRIASCFSLLALAACAAPTGGSDGQPSASADDALAVAQDALTVAELDFEGGQRIVFLATGPDEISVHETGELGTVPILANRPAIDLVDLYTQLAPAIDPDVVAKLERADQRAAELVALRADEPLPPEEEPLEPQAAAPDGVAVTAAALENVVMPSPWTTAAQFQAAMCEVEAFGMDGGVCAINTTFAHTGWTADTSFIRSIVMHARSSGTVGHKERKWVCITKIPIEGSCIQKDWRTVATQTVRPGQYGMFTSTDKWVKYEGSTADAAFHLGAVWRFR